MNELVLFAGAGGGILGGKLLGWRTRCAVEIDPYCRSVLLARQRDGHLDPFPIWDDINTFDGRPWRGSIDIVTGGFPCQDISAAGKGRGLAGERSGLWFEMLRIIGEVRPRFVLAENSPNLRSRGLGTVLEGLASLGYDAKWGVLGAWHVGAPHRRNRMWVVAKSTGERCGSRGAGGFNTSCTEEQEKQLPQVIPYPQRNELQKQPRRRSGADRQKASQLAIDDKEEPLADAKNPGVEIKEKNTRTNRCRTANNGVGSRWATEPDVGRVAHGVASRVDRLRAIGNGQVPQVVKLAWEILGESID